MTLCYAYRISRQNQTRREMFLNPNLRQACLVAKSSQFFRLKAPQNRKCAVFPNQTIVKEQIADGLEEIVCHGVAMQIDYENTATRDAIHLAKERDHLLVTKMM